MQGAWGHVADLRLFLHARLSALAGREVAECLAPPPGTLRAADLSPAGTVGWGRLSVDRTSWGPGGLPSPALTPQQRTLPASDSAQA